jgi:hypothetical protein
LVQKDPVKLGELAAKKEEKNIALAQKEQKQAK